MSNNNDNEGCGCGCGGVIIMIGVIIMMAFPWIRPEATGLEKFFFYAAVLLATIAVAALVIAVVNSLNKDDSDDGMNEGCLPAIFGFGGGGGGTPSNNNSSSESQYINLGSIIQNPTENPKVRTSNGDQAINQDNNEPEENNNDSEEPTNNNVINKGINNNYINIGIFNKLKKAVNQLNDFCYEQASDDELREYIVKLSQRGIVSLTNDIQNIANYLYHVAMKDVFTSMAEMGHPVSSLANSTYSINTRNGNMNIDCKKLEGQVLFAMLFIDENRYSAYADFRTVLNNVLKGVDSKDLDIAGEDLYKYVNSDVSVTADSVKDFQLSLIFGSINMTKEQTRYKKILYQIMSCFALADGVLEDKEKSFLKKLGNDAGIVDIGVTVDGAPNASIEDLNSLIGLQEVKQSISSLVNFIKTNQKRKALGMRVPSISYHCVFTGNPGTGKTTVARILAGIYKNLGILQKGQLIETDRSGLVAEYVGQTAVKTNKIIDQAIGGVLFIDEAYSLIGGGNEDYGKEAIATLLKRMEDNRDRLVVILAGYSNEMEEFIDSNPGLRSRFSRYIHFPDYSAEELYEIFLLNMKKFDYRLTADAESFLKELLKDKVAHKPKDFGNAREVRNLFEKVVEAQSDRLQNIENLTKDNMSELTIDDIRRASQVS